ncbi:MAG: hypothetical protein JWP36_815 [Paucimonas sp.]|nr:hypothetical protein [Paucimonas sp.]
MKVLPSAGRARLTRAASNLSREKIDILFLIVTCALIMAPHGAHLPPWITQVALGLLAWRCWITLRGDRLPPRWLLLPVCLAVMTGVLFTYQTMLGRDTGVAMLVLLIAFKLLEMHAKRDAFVVVFLSFFLILMNFFYSQTVVTTALMAVAVVLVLTVQISFQYAQNAPPLRERLRLAGSIVGLALPLMVVLFLLFPRFHGPFWGGASQSSSGTTGLSDSMAPGHITKLALSSDIAYRVEFIDPVPRHAALYWRGPVLGVFDGRTWTPAPVRRNQAQPTLVRANDRLTRYRVTLEPTGQHSLFALEMPAQVPRIAAQSVTVQTDLQLLARTPVNQRIRYEAASYLDFQFSAPETARSLRDWVQLPPGFNPRTHELATQMLATSSDPNLLVQKVLEMFRQQNFRYTLEPPALGEHTVDEFLFSTRAGFCEHYASAFVVLMRAMDIPARVVTGYQGGEVNRLDGYMTVRQSDAHAWTEVWLGERGWVRVDPTAAIAPGRIESSLRSEATQTLLGGLVSFNMAGSKWEGALQNMRMNWDAINNRWNQMVLDYSATRQRNLLESLGFRDPGWRTLAALSIACFSLVMVAMGLPLLRNRRRRDRLEALYDRFCQSLSRQGMPRELHEGPRGWRNRLQADRAAANPDKLRAWCEFLEVYEKLRYAGPPVQAGAASRDPDIARLRKLLRLCR